MPLRASASRPALSIIVPTRDRPEKLDRCLSSVVAAAGPDDEVVVVDSASVDASAVASVAARHGARLVRCDLPGVCRARNAGWRAAAHEHLAYTDDDVTVADGWADAFATGLASFPGAAFLTGRISIPEGQVGAARAVAIKDDVEPATLTAQSRGDLGHSASLALRASALAQVGGWDESLGAGGRFPAGPEIDLFDRLFGAGFEGRYEPAARAWHDQWRGKTEVVKLDWRYGVGTGARLSKLVRADRPRARQVAVDVVWVWTLKDAGRSLRSRSKGSLACDVSRLGGLAAGFARGLAVPVRDGHFVARGAR